MSANSDSHYDVVVLGGALSGGATATLLLRQNPGFTLKATDVNLIVKALANWLRLEFTEGWRSWGKARS